MLHRILVPIHHSNVGREIVPSWHRNSGPITSLQMVTRETPAAKATEAATPHREPGDICALATPRLSLPKKNGFSTDRPMLSIVTQKREVTRDPSGFFRRDSVRLK